MEGGARGCGDCVGGGLGRVREVLKCCDRKCTPVGRPYVQSAVFMCSFSPSIPRERIQYHSCAYGYLDFECQPLTTAGGPASRPGQAV